MSFDLFFRITTAAAGFALQSMVTKAGVITKVKNIPSYTLMVLLWELAGDVP